MQTWTSPSSCLSLYRYFPSAIPGNKTRLCDPSPGELLKDDYVKMMRKKYSNVYGKMSDSSTTTTSSSTDEEIIDWEMRSGGMLVQKRSDRTEAPVRNVRLRIAYGALSYEMTVNSEATFGEVKKLLSVETGLQPDEQRLIYRGKERENGEYLDICGIKDRSKLALIQDPISIEKRYLEIRQNAWIQSVLRAIANVSMEVDKLAEQISAIETSISKGSKVAEVQITTLIEMLMRQAIKLDSISAAGDSSTQKNFQVKRVQMCVETLDVLKVSNAKVKPVTVTTKWENYPPSTTALWEIFD